MTDTTPIARMDAHERDALAFRIQVIASGARFLVMPHRDPEQPRFWCVVVAKCGAGGMVDPSEPAVIAQRHVSRDDLAATLAAIRPNLDAWLTAPSRESLLAWLLASPPAPLWDATNGSLRFMETVE